MSPEERQAAVARVLADFPPLDEEQRARLTILLRAAGPRPATVDQREAA